jgi:Spy/CpxP family protein refolding chaperone
MNRILKAVVLAALMATLVFAQTTTTPPSPPSIAEIVANQVAHLTKLLDLTSDQQLQATTIFTTQQTGLQGLQTSMQTAQTALQTAITSNSATGLTAAATVIGNLTAQQTLIQATGTAAFYAILTSDQQTKFTELNNPPQGGPGPSPGQGGGPGGPGGGGPPPPPK